jgi:hypothetical protein
MVVMPTKVLPRISNLKIAAHGVVLHQLKGARV